MIEFKLDLKSGVPFHRQIMDQIRRGIASLVRPESGQLFVDSERRQLIFRKENHPEYPTQHVSSRQNRRYQPPPIVEMLSGHLQQSYYTTQVYSVIIISALFTLIAVNVN